MYYIFLENNKLNGAGQCKQLTAGVVNLEITEELYNAYIETPEKYICSNGEIIENPNYEAEQAQKERDRLNMLSLTAADVERAIYKAKGMDFEDVLGLVRELQTRESQTRESQTRESQLVNRESENNTAHESRITTHELNLKALKIELKANNFYRGNPYIEQVGALLGFTPLMLDEFFETGDYTKLLPIEEEVNEDTTNTESDIQIQQPVEDSIPEEEITG